MAKKKKRKEPPYEDARRCLELRKKSKRGEPITEEEMNFNHLMWKKYRQWYSDTQAEVFNDTVPFGSQVRME